MSPDPTRPPSPPAAVRRRRGRPAVAVALVAVAVGVAAGVALAVGPRRSAEQAGSEGRPGPTVEAEDSARPLATTTTALDEPTVVADPTSLTVLVNKVWRLPPGWQPPDLVVPAVTFAFSGDDPKRQLREPAARALEELFAAAQAAGTPLAVVSGFRSEATQAQLFAQTADEDGPDEAARRQAPPGHSEHQTGLAVDVTTVDGACPAEACFALTPAAAWLAAHAPEHGFVIRYPADGEAVTGYSYEPWHLRFVGVAVARRLHAEGLVLEELPG